MSTKDSRNRASIAGKSAHIAEMEAGELPLLYQRLVEMSPNGIIVNAGDHTVFANQIAADILDALPVELGMCRILLVDDHELARHGTKAWLETVDDMEVVGEADTGDWAIVKAQELEPDVILMDIHMPSVNGIEATKRIMEALPGCKVILLTVYDDDDHVREGIRAGAKGYLVKGAGREEILSGIRTVFAGGSLVSASVLGSLAEDRSQNQGPGVTTREREVLMRLASAAPTKQIAAELVVSENTVNYHLRNLYQKLGVKNRTQAIRASEAAGLLKSSTD